MEFRLPESKHAAIILFFFTSVLLTGCATPKSSHFVGSRFSKIDLPYDESQPNKIILMPLDVGLYEKTPALGIKLNEEWTQNAKDNLKIHLKTKFDHPVLNLEFIEPNQAASDQYLNQYAKLYDAVLSSIFAHEFGNYRLPAKNNPDVVWTLGSVSDQESLLSQYDYALFIRIHDTYSDAASIFTHTLANVALLATAAAVGSPFHVGVPVIGEQNAYTSLVDLKTGNIVWFDWMSSISGDLRTEDEAIRTVRAMYGRLPYNRNF